MKKSIGNYLLDRLLAYDIEDVFGVPGDYNLGFLDLIDDKVGLNWIGNCNELNAAYAADGYGRIRPMSALVTTFGVGELSAINGVAGAYAESVPLVKIVGMPSRNISKNRKLVHHTLGDGDFFKFYNMYKEVTVAQTILDIQNAKEEIDRVLRECYLHKKPVYIGLPVDIVNVEIETYLPTNYKVTSNEETLKEFLKDTTALINSSHSQCVLADYEVNRYKLNNEFKSFIETSNLPVASLSMGKGVLDENHENFIGIYNGILSDKNVTSIIKHSDCLLFIGVKLTDSITAGFNYINNFNLISIIEIHPLYSKIGEKIYEDILMEDVLKLLSSNTNKINFHSDLNTIEKIKPSYDFTGSITQNNFFSIIEKNLREDDVLIAEQGTSFFGAGTIKLPSNGIFVGQPLWGSIGYTLAALLGTSLADRKRRNILLIGDGSFQLTAQELSTILRENLTPIIIVINNDGYTVERFIHGPKRKYNDINMWNYSELIDIFDFNLNTKPLKFKVSTVNDLESALNESRKTPSKLSFIEVSMDKFDAPELLKNLGDLFSKQNNY